MQLKLIFKKENKIKKQEELGNGACIQALRRPLEVPAHLPSATMALPAHRSGTPPPGGQDQRVRAEKGPEEARDWSRQPFGSRESPKAQGSRSGVLRRCAQDMRGHRPHHRRAAQALPAADVGSQSETSGEAGPAATAPR